MNYLKSFFNYETYRKFSVYLKPSTYYLHPELKIKGIPSQRYKLLMTMRDLRLWIVENAPYSSRAETYQKEIFRLHNEITYLQYKAFFAPLFAFLTFTFWFIYWSPRNYHGGWSSSENRPVHYGTTGGMSVFHDGAIPKLMPSDMSDILGV